MNDNGGFREARLLGRTGLKVGRLGVAAGYGVPAEAIEHAFHDYGVNYFYWGSLRRAGMREAIRRLAPRHREELVIVLQSYDRFGPFMPGSIERALKALQLDYADVLLLGWHNQMPSRRLLDTALDLKARGRIRFIAMSSHHRPTLGALGADPHSEIDILMVRYNAAHRGAEKEVFPLLNDTRRPGVTAYTATRWGQLLNPRKMPAGEKPMSAAECYRFALSHPSVDLCMTGPSSAEHMAHALTALDAGPLSDEELERIRRIGDHVHG